MFQRVSWGLCNVFCSFSVLGETGERRTAHLGRGKECFVNLVSAFTPQFDLKLCPEFTTTLWWHVQGRGGTQLRVDRGHWSLHSDRLHLLLYLLLPKYSSYQKYGETWGWTSNLLFCWEKVALPGVLCGFFTLGFLHLQRSFFMSLCSYFLSFWSSVLLDTYILLDIISHRSLNSLASLCSFVLSLKKTRHKIVSSGDFFLILRWHL